MEEVRGANVLLDSVLQFLYRGEGLNKTAIGDYLGEKHEFNEAVLKAFVSLHDFTDLILVQVGIFWRTFSRSSGRLLERMFDFNGGDCFVGTSTVSLEFSITRRSAENRSHDGNICSTILSTEPRYFYQYRYVLRS